jgi:formylglycine-generating enzyme
MAMRLLSLKKIPLTSAFILTIALLTMELPAAKQPEKTTPASFAMDSIIDMVKIEGGSFVMGSDSGRPDEKPAHRVTVAGFYLDKTEVTQEAFERVMGKTPSLFKGCPNCPVEQVSWQDAHDYCAKVNKRLPAEAEWEFACRAGGKSAYAWGDTVNGDNAWYSDNAGRKTHPVGQKKPNGFGLCDMSGNVYEWCFDWFIDYASLKNLPQKKGVANEGDSRVMRGGSWNNNVDGVSCTSRGWDIPDAATNNVGFRCAR